jgi:energy-coupling factor transport system permease protein
VSRSLDVRAWALWLVACFGVLFVFDHPAVDLVVIVAAAVVASGGSGRVFRSFLVLGLVLLTVRTLLYALTGHTGTTELLTLPSLHLPALLGGATLGGKVTAEVLTASIAEGLRIVAVISCFGAFIAVTENIEVIRLLPRFLFEAGLIVSIAMAFAPQLGRTARDVRDAQIMRGVRRRLGPIVIPVVASALERSTALAESMDSRGYGRLTSSSIERGVWSRIAVASGLATSALAALWTMGKAGGVTGPLTGVAAGLLLFSLAQLSSRVPRVRYRRRSWGAGEWLVISVSLGVAIFALAYSLAGQAALQFNPYNELALPAPRLPSVLFASLLAVPAVAIPRPKSDQ